MQAPSSTNPEVRQFEIDSGASMHMLSKSWRLSSDPDLVSITMVTANGEVQTNEEAEVYENNLHLCH